MFKKSGIFAVGSDHAGFALKEFLKDKLRASGYTVKDFGAFSTDSVDYPDVAHPLAAAVNEGVYARGLLVCGSGNGVCMVANKYPNIRAALCWNTEQARLTRMHNNANILCLPGRFIDFEEAYQAVTEFLTTNFEGGRHQVRVNKIPLTI
jgi:ribose 5-phosphate isomerase B